MPPRRHKHYWKDWDAGSAICRCGLTLDQYEAAKTPAQKVRDLAKCLANHAAIWGPPEVCGCLYCNTKAAIEYYTYNGARWKTYITTNKEHKL